MRFGKARIDFERSLGGGQGVFVLAVDEAELRLGKRHQRPCLCIVRVQRRGLPTDTDDALVPAHIAEIAADPLVPRQEIKSVGIDI